MKQYLKVRIGNVNLLCIGLIAGVVGFLSILSLAAKGQLDGLKEHLFTSFISRFLTLMCVSLVLLAALVFFNIAYYLIANKKVSVDKVLAVLIKGLLASGVVAAIGLAFFFAGI
ncbi:MAG: hypothetical protein H0X33_02435 [Taibaiella sp.]|nr:hypothetical protein [Taibaiella sp.]